MSGLFDEGEGKAPQEHQLERRARFANLAAERIRAAEECQFSLLPFDELARMASGWYEACSQALLRGNYAAIDELIHKQAQVAAEQGFELADILELLRICRRSAIEVDKWNEDVFSAVDDAISEGFGYLRGKVPWTIPEGFNYLTGRGAQEEGVAPAPEEPRGERRVHRRNRLQLPIRVRGTVGFSAVEEVTRTENVARGGVYFHSTRVYHPGIGITVTYPYWEGPGAINKEYPAKIVRIDFLPDGNYGVAVQFLVSLGQAAAS